MGDLFGPPSNLRLNDWPRDYREQFWQAYPRKVSKLDAMKALDKVLRSGDVRFERILEAVERYKAWLSGPGWRPDPKHPATWLNKGCWDDEYKSTGRLSFADIASGALSRQDNR